MALSAGVVHPTTARAAPPTGGTTIVSETFQGATVADTAWVAQGITCLTGAPAGTTPSPNIPNCSGARTGLVPREGTQPGYLQLTDTRNNGVGSIFYNRPIPATAGISVTFEQYQYGGSGADGIGFFLVDGATNLTATGANGGSLGYAQKTGQNGILGGYVGVGLDAYGNYYNDAEGRGTNCPPDQSSPSTVSGADAPNVITVRGPGSGQNGYCYQESTTTPTNDPNKPASTLHGTLRQSNVTSISQIPSAARLVNIQITPAPNPQIIVQVNYGSGWITELQAPAPPNPPSTYKFGFSASTGGSTDVHLIRNVTVTTIDPLNALQIVKQVDRTKPALPAVITAGTTIPYQYVVTNAGTQTVHALAIADDRVSGPITCAATTLPPAPDPGATTICTGSYVVTAADVATGSVTNTASASALDPANGTVTSNQATVTVPLVAQLSLAKSVSTRPPYAVGQQISYSYTVTNTGGATVSSIAVTDDRVAAGGVTCGQSSLDPGASTTCTATTTIQAGQLAGDGSLTNTAAAAGVTPIGQQVSSNVATATINVGTDVGVTKTVDDASPPIGSDVTFTVTATNHGPGVASAAVVNDLLPSGLTLVSATASQGSYNPTSGNWAVGTLQVGQAEALTIVARVDTAAAVTNAATLTSLAQPDLNSRNNADSVVVNPVVPTTDIAITKSVDQRSIRLGQDATFTVTATNNGPAAATGVTVIDAIPNGLTFVSSDGDYDPGSALWTVGSLAVNATKTLHITVRADATGSYQNTAGLRDVSPQDINQANNVDTAALAVTPKEADLQIVKNIVSGTDNLQVGDHVTYSVTVTNAGPDAVPDAVVTDTPVSGLTVLSATPSQGSVDIAGLTWTVGALDPGATATIFVIVRIDTQGTKDNLATVSSATVEDPDLTNNTSEASFSASPQQLDIAVTKSVDDASPALGSNVTFTVTATNNGPSDATNLVLGDALPAGLTFVSADPSANYDTGTGLWTVGSLASGGQATLTVVARADSPGTATNTAALRTVDQADTDPTNNSASAIVDVTQRADLQLTKTVSPTVATPGQVVTYTVTITNHGPNTADDIRAVDPVQVQVDVVGSHATQGSFDASRLEWDVGTLHPNETATLTVRVKADLVGTFLNTAVISQSGVPDPNLANNSDTATLQVPAADLADTKTVDNAAPEVGETVRFTVTAKNLGPDQASAVQVRDPLPSGLEYVSSTASTGSYDPASGIWTIGSMLPNTTPETLTIVARVTAPGRHVNTATISSGSPDDPTPSNNTATADVDATPVPADVSVTKTVTPRDVPVGATATFTITAHNRGPGPASSLVVRDAVPEGLRIVSVAPSACTVRGQVVTCAFGELAVGASAVATVRVRATAPGNYLNHATAEAQPRDPAPPNNTATASLTVKKPVGAGSGTGPSPGTAAGGSATGPIPGTAGGGSATSVTGTDVRDLLVAGLLLLLSGGLVALLATGRRRREQSAGGAGTEQHGSGC